jgi:large subunit ribosomal protein L6
MSRIGKKPIAIPAGVQVEVKGQTVKVTGPKGALERSFVPEIEIRLEAAAKQVLVNNLHPDNRQAKAMHGTTRALIQNMIVGVTQGFGQELQIFGTGYNVKEQSGKLVLTVGFSDPIELPIPKAIKVAIKTPATKGNDIPAVFSVSSPDKQVLGQFAAEIRRVRPPEPYQGKGIRFSNEVVRRKVGKAFASGSA